MIRQFKNKYEHRRTYNWGDTIASYFGLEPSYGKWNVLTSKVHVKEEAGKTQLMSFRIRIQKVNDIQVIDFPLDFELTDVRKFITGLTDYRNVSMNTDGYKMVYKRNEGTVILKSSVSCFKLILFCDKSLIQCLVDYLIYRNG